MSDVPVAAETGNASAKRSTGAAAGTKPAATLVRRYGSRIDEILFHLLLVGLAFSPFWFGSNRSVAWGVNAVYFGTLTLAYEIVLLASDRDHPVALRRIWFPALAFALVAVWSHVQAGQWVQPDLQHPIWQMARDALGQNVRGSISVDRDKTIVALMRFTTCASAFWLALQLCRSGRRSRRLVQAVALIGAAYALYGIIAFFVFPHTILWFGKSDYGESVTSTFVNRNSYATYAGIGLAAQLCIIFRLYQNRAAPVGRRIFALIALTLGAGGIWIACAFITGVALVLTGSRGGVVAAFVGILALAILAVIRARKSAGFGLLAAGLTAGAAFFAYGDFLTDRLLTEGVVAPDRLATYSLTWRSVLDAPFFGFGDGSFQSAFPMYHDKSIVQKGSWDHAHNSYLEALQGLGVPMAAVLLAGLLALMKRSTNGALTRRNFASAPVASSVATVIVALHAFVDFSVQMQAVALTWIAILGAGVAQSWSSKIATDR